MKKKEIWKEYPIDVDFEGNFKIEVSNLGRMRTYNQLTPDGKLVGGSQQGGYPCLRSKLRKKWSERDTNSLQELKDKVDELNTQIKETSKSKENEKLIADLRKERDQWVQKRKKLNHKLTTKNTINFNLLFHKAVAELFLDPPAKKTQKFIIHKDFDKTNNDADNLAWASQADISKRVKKHPKMILWEFNKQFIDTSVKVKSSKLTEMDVLTIKKRLKRGYSLKKLAKQFEVSDMQIHRIKTGENWGHVQLLEDIRNENSEK